MKIKKLQRNTTYTITASIFDGNFTYRHISFEGALKTLENEFYVPNSVLNDTIKLDYDIGNSSNTLLTTINWAPTEGRYCT